MKTFSHLWQYLAEFFFECKTFQIKVVEKIKTHILHSVTFFRKSSRLGDKVEIFGGAREAWIGKATRAKACVHAYTHTDARKSMHSPARAHKKTRTQKYVILITWSRQQWFRKRASLLRYTYIACRVWTISGLIIAWIKRRSCMVCAVRDWWIYVHTVQQKAYKTALFTGHECQLSTCGLFTGDVSASE
jgi:hypothetical protein